MEYTRRRRRYRVPGLKDAGITAALKWTFATKRAKWPRKIENASYPPPPLHVYGHGLTATWIGHSTVLLQTAGLNILTDPFFAARASPFTLAGPKRVRPPGLKPADMPPIDIVLISHNHYDHLDRIGLKQLLRDHDPLFVTPLGNRKHLRGLSASQDIVELDWRQAHTIGSVRITVMPALHWSKRSLDDQNMSLWGAFAIETPGGLIYFAGDTGYGQGSTFREVHDRFGAPRLSLLPIGAYEPQFIMKPVHMNPAEAVRAHLDLQSHTSLAIHHGTIQLTNEAIDQPLRDLEIAMRQHGIPETEFLTPDVGAPIQIS
jgi:L-ascorbate metabolism protein UlaG (beta-lactamase superfamily)